MEQDIIIRCSNVVGLSGASCNKQFSWTAAGQRFFAEHGYQQPKYCHECRELRSGKPVSPARDEE